MSDPVRDGIQKILDLYDDGWTVTHFIVCMGLERITSEGELETSSWQYTPPGQAPYITTGLLTAEEGSTWD